MNATKSMEEHEFFKLILGLKEFQIPIQSSLNKINSNILETLQKNKHYVIKSDICEDVLKEFIEFLIYKKTPQFNLDNINEFDLISQEFNVMKNLVQIYRKQKNHSILPLLVQNNELKQEIQSKYEEFQTKKEKYRQIIDLIFSFENITHYIIYDEKKYLQQSCENYEIEDIKSYSKITLDNDDDGITYVLDEKEKTASIKRVKSEEQEIFIPRSIIYESQEYIVTKFLEDSFLGSPEIEDQRIIFPDDFGSFSEIRTIERKAFFSASFESITLPASVCDLKLGWCSGENQIKRISVMPNSQYFKNFQDIFILGKSDPKSDIFDSIIFANRDIEVIFIPSFIKTISPYAFCETKDLKRVEFDSDSQLQIIGEYAFDSSSIQEIIIPSHVKKIRKRAFSFCKDIIKIEFAEKSELETIEEDAFSDSSLKRITIPSSICNFSAECFDMTYCITSIQAVSLESDNEHYINYENIYILGKSHPKSDIYDVLVFANRYITSANIPSFIHEIGPHAFSSCKHLRKVIFSDNSELRKIGNSAFSRSGIENIAIPSSVYFIGENAFSFCNQLKKVEFFEDSKLRIIKKFTFTCSGIEELVWPPSIEKLEVMWCRDMRHLVKIILLPNNTRFCYYENKFLLGKSNPKSDTFDVILFANKNIEHAVIPSFITQIGSYAFDCNKKLKKIDFPDDSQLKIIKESAFSHTSLKHIKIPSSVTHIEQSSLIISHSHGNVEFASNPKNINISPRTLDFFSSNRKYINDFNFQELPYQYVSQKNNIQNKFIQKIYANINFSYFPSAYYVHNGEYNQILNFFFTYFKKYKFITYYFAKIPDKSQNINEFITDTVICVEGKCLIIEKIGVKLINDLIDKLHNESISLINANIELNDNQNIQKEIKSFCMYCRYEMRNSFVQLTISSIACYLIRRYYYPSNYFTDSSFFNFVDDYSKEKQIKNPLFELTKVHNFENITFNDLYINVSSFISKENQTYDNFINNSKNRSFEEKDFIILRKIYSNYDCVYYLVMHIQSLYIFVMKKFSDYHSKEVQHEIQFCENHSHRCMCLFYGFLCKGEKKIGFIYEFMSNGSLSSYISSDKFDNDNFFLLTVIIRMYHCLVYFRSNHLIHRDIKPSNILLNHDFQPFLSDFETICSLDEKYHDSLTNNFTGNIGTMHYTSPEQYKGKILSYATDIYSFGLIIYYLFEKENMLKGNVFENYEIEPMTKGSNNIHNFYKSCVNFSPEKRSQIDETKVFITNEINSFEFLMSYFQNLDVDTKSPIFNQFFFESMIILHDNIKSMNACYNNLKACIYFVKCREIMLKSSIEKFDLSNLFYQLGNAYCQGIDIKKDYLIAKNFFELSSKQNNLNATINLGLLYQYGLGIDQNFSKAKEYFEIAAEQNNSDAFVQLGLLYQNGLGVNQDFSISRKFYEKAAEQNNSNAIYNLGLYYLYGIGVDKNYEKAKMYIESSAKQKNECALCCLGKLYHEGIHYPKDLWKAREYYDMSAQQNNSTALCNLGILYQLGEGVKKDYLMAKQYYELAAKQDNPKAFNLLGFFYLNGDGVEQNYAKAHGYFELSAKLNNLESFYYLGFLTMNGIGVEKDYLKAIKYFESSAELNNPLALFELSVLYSNGDIIQTDIQKSIHYLKRSSNIRNYMMFYKEKFTYKIEIISNICRSRSLNNLGLIYLTIFNDFAKAKDLIKEAAFSEYQFAQNNFGLIYQFYLNELGNAEYMYKRSSEHNFALAEYNLGHLKENEGQVDQAIKYFINASNHEDELLIYQGYKHYDKRLEISKMFIICLTNLKIVDYYLSVLNYEEAKKYFIKAFTKLIKANHTFNFKLHYNENKSNNSIECNENDEFSQNSSQNTKENKYMHENSKENKQRINKKTQLDQPKANDELKQMYFNEDKKALIKFSLKQKQKKESQNIFYFDTENLISDFNYLKKFIFDFHLFSLDVQDDLLHDIHAKENDTNIGSFCISFNDPGKLFSFITENSKLMIFFISTIKSIIHVFDDILYIPPYSILFGRINIENTNINDKAIKKSINFVENINEKFYEGFNFE